MPTIAGSSSADVIDGGAGNDTLSGSGGGDTINGGDGNDVIYGHSAGAGGAITSSVLVSGLSLPVAGATAPGDDGFIYIVEKDSGIIWRVDETTGARTSFLDIPQGDFTRDGERGALGLAFHPDYESNGRFYVFLTDAQGDLQVRQYTRGVGDPPVANASSTLIIEIPHASGTNHNGGWIEFSPTDGYLYIATGDGGGSGDPSNNAQNLNSLLGKILRIDVNSDGFPADASKNYAIPAANPFASSAGADEIWAYGLRNPWRAAFDPRNGDLYIGDVGQGAREEIDYIANGVGGLNFGWRIMEGNQPYPPGAPNPNNPALVAPIFDYPRDIGTTVTGGEVYAGDNAAFVGQYVFADYGSDRLFTLRVEAGGALDVVDRTGQIVGSLPVNLVDFVTGTDGALFAIGIGGTIWRLTPANGAEDVGDMLSGGGGNDTIHGDLGNDTLNGDAGDDVLDGGAGADTMAGGADNDTYIVDNISDVITEGVGAGTDSVQANITWFLEANVETLTLTGASAINGSGNGLNNVITGNGAANQLFGQAGNDVLDGGAGADFLYGGEGDDSYYVDVVGDQTYEAQFAWGVDTVYSTALAYSLGTNIDNLILLGSSNSSGSGNLLNNFITGNTGANILYGFAGNDTLDGGAGIDQMYGGEGDDTYYIDHASDQAFEAQFAWGTDLAIASISYNILNNIDNLTITGSAFFAKGNTLNNALTGNAGNNELFGYGGNDVIDGGAGADNMYGGEGDDTYYVDNAADFVYEAQFSWGADLVYSSISYNITGNIDNLTLTGSANNWAKGNALGNALTGNSGSNELFGYGGNDILDGGAGADAMYGAEGDDTYYVDNAGDITFEGNAGWGTDLTYASVSHTLGTNIDNLILTGTADLAGTGNGLANVITGNSGANALNGAGGADTLNGAGGADTLNGGLGNDTLTGGGGNDAFVFVVGSGADVVADFVAGGVDDTLDLSAYDGSGVTWSVTQLGADTLFSFTNGDTITLANVNMNTLVQLDSHHYG